jgi:hypothetical protein
MQANALDGWTTERSARWLHRFVSVSEETKRRTFSNEISEHAPRCRVSDLPRAVEQQELSVNHSLYSADRLTHLKIVVAALIAGIAVVGVGISMRLRSDDGDARSARVIKAGEVVTITSSSANPVR